MDVVAIRQTLSDACGTVDGLRGAPTIPEQVVGNTAIVQPDDTHTRGDDQFITYLDALNGGLTTLRFEVVLLVPIHNGLDRAQNTLDGYISAGTGQTASVFDALMAVTSPPLKVSAARKYGVILAGGTECATVTLVVTVYTPRS